MSVKKPSSFRQQTHGLPQRVPLQATLPGLDPSTGTLDGSQRIPNDHYAKTKLLRPGSSDYYAWRFTPPAHQPAWLALASLQQTLWDVVLDYREAGVAQAKLLWWSEEIVRTIAGQPEHPITQSLLAALPDIVKTQGLLTEWIEGVMAAMLCQHLCTDADFSLMAKRSIAIPALLLCRYHDVQDEHTITVISQQSEILLFDRYLGHRQRLLSQGQIWLPLQRLEQASLSPENVGELTNAKVLRSLLSEWLDKLYQPNVNLPSAEQTHLDAANKSRHVGDRGKRKLQYGKGTARRAPTADYMANWQTLNAEQQAVLKYPHTLTRIAYKRCARFLKRPDVTWTTAINDLTPLGKLWLAWH